RDPRVTIGKLLNMARATGGSEFAGMVSRRDGLLGGLGVPATLPPWISAADLDFYAGEFARTGFRGGLNWYRNIDRNWALMAPWQGAQIRQPSLFIAGSKDAVITGPMGRLLADMDKIATDLKGKILIEGGGHWIQQEKPKEVQ